MVADGLGFQKLEVSRRQSILGQLFFEGLAGRSACVSGLNWLGFGEACFDGAAVVIEEEAVGWLSKLMRFLTSVSELPMLGSFSIFMETDWSTFLSVGFIAPEVMMNWVCLFWGVGLQAYSSRCSCRQRYRALELYDKQTREENTNIFLCFIQIIPAEWDNFLCIKLCTLLQRKYLPGSFDISLPCLAAYCNSCGSCCTWLTIKIAVACELDFSTYPTRYKRKFNLPIAMNYNATNKLTCNVIQKPLAHFFMFTYNANANCKTTVD
ncbi:NADH-quinone oxidoreductase subunit D [Striga asiatica]|uniref:NADH-quinone oxidoreductase subunit D n=1 Tax=Striga asiatica TaxID=4170 RepID=A0A5A7QHI8_STRAF|nr:NADH-quinone oxidoreductase subunit D [Striga asiatica]